jgi:flavin-dependent dehydrogenase
MFAYDSYDALVVGARCAGAATAMLLARKGWRVLVIDRGSHGTDTISTHALRIRGRWKYLYRAVDKAGDTVDFLLSAKRDRKAARRFHPSASCCPPDACAPEKPCPVTARP